MKTLAQEVNAIKERQASKATKRRMYKALSLTDADISYLLDSDDNVTDGNRTATFTFGVEIECGVNPGRLRDAAQQSGMCLEYEHYNHRDNHTHFKFVTDGSLNHSLAHGNPIECVSPVLKGNNGRKTLKNAIDTLNNAGAEVDRSCGLHVHIGAAKLTPQQYANVFVNYAWLERVIDTFMAPSRRGNAADYAHSIEVLLMFSNTSTREEVRHRLNGRYYKVNPVAYESHKTIEFRQHQGTVNADKILNWVMFCGKLVNWSKTHRLNAETVPHSIDELPFINDKEKAFFKRRAAEFDAR